MLSGLGRHRERKLVQWGVAYLGGAWLILQVVDIVGPQFGVSEGLLRGLTVVLAVGFPMALVLAWHHGEKGRQRPTAFELTLLAGLTLAAAAGAALASRERAPTPNIFASLAEGVALAVLPFDNLNHDPEQQYFVDGMTDALTTTLASLPGLRVISRGSTTRFAGTDRPLSEIAAELGVGSVVEGSVLRDGSSVRITVQLLAADPERQVWGEAYERQIRDVLPLQREIAGAVARAVEAQVASAGRGEDPRDRRGLAGDARGTPATVDPAVYELYLRGRYFWNQRDEPGLRKAVEQFQQAIALDPEWAPAYSGLADTYLTMYDYELMDPNEASGKAREAVRKALALDGELGEAHKSLAHLHLHDWNWSEAEREFRLAIELDPSNAGSFHWYALCLTALGRTDEAVDVMLTAQRLDPLSIRINTDLGMAYHAAGRNDEAIEQEGKMLELNADFPPAYWIRGMAEAGKGDYESAIRDFEEALRRGGDDDPNVLAALGHTYAVSGRPEKAREIVRGLEARAGAGAEEPVSPFVIALVYAGLADNDAAIAWLDRAVEKRDGSVRYLRVDPRLAAVRADPRFAELMRRVGL